MKTTTQVITAIILLAALAACDTIQGFGTDVSKGGNDISNSAARNK